MVKSKKLNSVILAAVFLVVAINVVLMVFSFSLWKNTQNIQPAARTSSPFTGTPSATGLDSLSALSLDGFEQAQIELQPNLLIVKSGCLGIPMTPTEQQLRSIQSAVANQSDVRPSTHDLMQEMFNTFGIQVLQAKIVDADEAENIYYARLVVKQADKVLNLDAKPSDAIAVALRAGVPLYIKKDIMGKKGQDICAKS